VWLGATEGLVATGRMRRDPLAGHPLGFGYLCASYQPPYSVSVTLRTLTSLSRRDIEPHIGKHPASEKHEDSYIRRLYRAAGCTVVSFSQGVAFDGRGICRPILDVLARRSRDSHGVY
jgi:hypothetical protein